MAFKIFIDPKILGTVIVDERERKRKEFIKFIKELRKDRTRKPVLWLATCTLQEEYGLSLIKETTYMDYFDFMQSLRDEIAESNGSDEPLVDLD